MNKIYIAQQIVETAFILLLVLIFFLIYKFTSKEFHKFTKKRLIADMILFSIHLFLIVYALGKGFTTFAGTMLSSELLLLSIFILFFGIGLIIEFYAIHLYVCSFIGIYRFIFKKRFRKKKRDFIISVLYLIFLNQISRTIIKSFLILFVITLIARIYPTESCGITILFPYPDSPAEKAGITQGETMFSVNNQKILTTQDLTNFLLTKKPGEIIMVQTDKGKHDVSLGEKNGRAFLGVSVIQKLCPKQKKTKCDITVEKVVYTPEGEPIVLETSNQSFGC